MVTCEFAGRSPGVTSFHVSPSSVDTWTRPSSDPVMITPRRCFDSISEKIVAYISAPAVSIVSGPDTPMVSGSARVRSGLIASHFSPSSRDRKSLLPAA